MSNNTNKKTSFAAAFKNNLRAWKILFELASVLISAILQTRYKTYIRSYGAIR